MDKLKDIWFTIFLALLIFFLLNYMRLCVIKSTLNPYHIRIPKISFSRDKEENKRQESSLGEQEEGATQNMTATDINTNINSVENTQNQYIIQMDNNVVTNSNTSINNNTNITASNITVGIENNTNSEIVILVGE